MDGKYKIDFDVQKLVDMLIDAKLSRFKVFVSTLDDYGNKIVCESKILIGFDIMGEKNIIFEFRNNRDLMLNYKRYAKDYGITWAFTEEELK